MSNATVTCDVDALTAAIEQVGARAVRGIAAMMGSEAEKIRDKARSNAPVDTHGLEDAIKCERVGGGRGQGGQFERVSWDIFVDLMHVNSEGKSIGKYAVIMHEELAPYGSGHSGDVFNPKYPDTDSKKKAAAGHDVGGKYLERAVDERREIISYKARDIAARATKS